MINSLVFGISLSTRISGIIGLVWAVIYVIFTQNIQTSIKLFLSSFLGGLIGGIVGCFVGYLVGAIASQEIYIGGGLFSGGDGFSWLFWFFIFWMIGLIVGAVLGGLIFIRIYS